MSEEKLKAHNLKPMARIVSYADAEIQPIDFSIAPHYAIKKIFDKTKLTVKDIDYFEINEAFSSVPLANQRFLDFPLDRLNVFGGAVALGHPIGASGARILQTLLTVMRVKGGKYGIAGICNGGGGGTAVLVENLHQKE